MSSTQPQSRNFPQYFQISAQLASLLQPAIARKDTMILTFRQLTEYLRLYVTSRNLIDESSRPFVIRCGEDPLCNIFGPREFTLDQVPRLLVPHCRKLLIIRPDLLVSPSLPPSEAAGCVDPSPVGGVRSAESVVSDRQGEADGKDGSDGGIAQEVILPPPETETSRCPTDEGPPSLGYESDADSDATATVIYSENEDETDEEQQCSQESGVWMELYGGVAAEETDIAEITDENYIYLDEMMTEYDFTEYEPTSVASSEGSLDCESESEQIFTAEAGTIEDEEEDEVVSGNNSDRKCVICLTRWVNATIIHESSAHFVCCLRCGKRLARKRKGCPVCRKMIETVILTFT